MLLYKNKDNSIWVLS